MAAVIFLRFLPLQASITAEGIGTGLCEDTFCLFVFLEEVISVFKEELLFYCPQSSENCLLLVKFHL